MKRNVIPQLGCLVALGLSAPTAFGVIVGQVDTFEDGTTQNWLVAPLGAPHPAPPVNVPTGGPAGVDDNFLLLTAVGGAGPGSRLSAINFVQWTGDFAAAGIGAIQMDVNNVGPEEVDLRLLLANPLAGPPTDAAFSQSAVRVPASSGWMAVTFPVLATDLVAEVGSVNAALGGVTELRLYHSTAPDFPGSSVVVQLGVDNIRAVAVPEPASGGLALAAGLLGLVATRRSRAA